MAHPLLFQPAQLRLPTCPRVFRTPGGRDRTGIPCFHSRLRKQGRRATAPTITARVCHCVALINYSVEVSSRLSSCFYCMHLALPPRSRQSADRCTIRIIGGLTESARL